MRSLFSSIFFFTTLLTFFYIKPIETISENSVINDSRIQGSCMMSRNNFNRSCIYHKIVYLFHKFPSISGWSIFRVGSLELIKLPEYATNDLSLPDERPTSKSLSLDFVSIISKSMEYFVDSYGIKIFLPPLSKSFPGIIVEEYSNGTQSINEGRHNKKTQKRFAMVFPLIAIFKFILIKALLIPILMGILAIKKMLVMAAMAVPTIIAMLRICRFNPGGFLGAGPFTAAAAATPLMAAPYVTSDTIIGDFSNYAPAMAAQQTPYYNKQQDYGGKSLNPLSPF